MIVPDMSSICKQYVRSLLQGVVRTSFQYLSQVQDQELFRALATPAREDMNDLFEEPMPAPGVSAEIGGVSTVPMAPWQKATINAASLGGKVLERTPQLNYAYHVVRAGKQNFAKGASAPNSSCDAWAKDYVHHCVAREQIPLDIDEDLTDSLPKPVADRPEIKESDYKDAATSLGIDVNLIKSVAYVESRGAAFGPDGRPTIRFELPVFRKKSGQVFDKTHPHVSQPYGSDGPYHNRSQAREYSLLYNAMLLNNKGASMVEQAIESASWGAFQIMGYHWGALGWPSALGFATDMFASEANQLSACVKFIQVNGLAPLLKAHNWAGFANRFNGSDYASNHYDTNLEAAFKQYSKATPAHR